MCYLIELWVWPALKITTLFQLCGGKKVALIQIKKRLPSLTKLWLGLGSGLGLGLRL